MNIKFYKYNGIPQVINKNPTLVTSISNGSLNQPFDMMDPIVTITALSVGDMLLNDTINYCNITLSKGTNPDIRWYYITGFRVIGSSIEIQLHLDVLKTYHNEIGKMRVMLERSSDLTNNKDIVDDKLPMSNYKQYDVEQLSTLVDGGKGAFSETEEDGIYILVTAQKGYTGV